MALYENGKRISGIRDFPAYTWAAYHALPVAKRPKVWKCTDRDYTGIPDVFYKDVAIAGKTLSNYYVAFDMGVDPATYQAIGFASVSGAWDTGLTVEVSTDNYMKLRSARTASYTVASNIKPIRVYFVKVGRITPLP